MTSEKGWLEKKHFSRVHDVLKVVYYPLIGTADDIADSDDFRDTTLEKITDDKTKSSYIQTITEDISKDGLSIITEKPLSVSQLVIIDLFLPRISKPIKILTEVTGIESVKGAGSHRAALNILSISKSDLRRIEKHIMDLKFSK